MLTKNKRRYCLFLLLCNKVLIITVMRRYIYFASIIFLASCLLSLTSKAQNNTPKFVTDSLDTYIEREMKAANIPGLSICIVKDGKVIVSKGYGVKRNDAVGKEATDNKVNRNTLFMIGSNTKAFTGTSIAILANENKCSLSDKVKKWVPEFCFANKWIEKEANLTDILSHRMGMQTFQGDFILFGSDLKKEDIIKKIGSLKPRHEFRTKWGYYNTGFVIAGEAIESISGMPWNKFFEKRIFTPLEMNNTVALSSEILDNKNIALAHTKVNGNMEIIDYCIMDEIGPAGSICSSAKDMSHWLMMQLNNGKYNGKQVLAPAVIKASRMPHSFVRHGRHPFNHSNFSLYGLGWNMEDYEGRKVVSHTGGIPGFLSSMTLVPENNLGIVILTNDDQNALFQALKWEIIDAYLNLPYRGYAKLYRMSTERYAKKAEAEKEAIRAKADEKIKTDIPLKEFTGKYYNNFYGYTTIEKKKKSLIISFEHHKGLTATLKHIGDNKFLCTFNSPVYGECIVPFETKDGEVSTFTLSLPPYLDPVKYTFTKK